VGCGTKRSAALFRFFFSKISRAKRADNHIEVNFPFAIVAQLLSLFWLHQQNHLHFRKFIIATVRQKGLPESAKSF
jgi:hypothetical protein